MWLYYSSIQLRNTAGAAGTADEKHGRQVIDVELRYVKHVRSHVRSAHVL